MERKPVYRYYSTQRPVDLGTFPRPPDNPLLSFRNYDARVPVEGGAMLAWGELYYGKPLTPAQMYHYELKPSRHNPDRAAPHRQGHEKKGPQIDAR